MRSLLRLESSKLSNTVIYYLRILNYMITVACLFSYPVTTRFNGHTKFDKTYVIVQSQGVVIRMEYVFRRRHFDSIKIVTFQSIKSKLDGKKYCPARRTNIEGKINLELITRRQIVQLSKSILDLTRFLRRKIYRHWFVL
jgi:hypothetical protein